MNEVINYNYVIEFSNGYRLRYNIHIDGTSLISQDLNQDEPPEWTELENEQCPHCPLQSNTHPYCPIAKKIAPIVGEWDNIASCTDTKVTVQSNKRTITTLTTAQKSLSSLLGLLMASSECPHTQFLRPLCRNHLPLASAAETTYRVISHFLLANYFKDSPPESEEGQIGKLARLYENLQTMNSALCVRLRGHLNHNASVNAITLLHALSFILPSSFKQSMGELKKIVAPISELLDREIEVLEEKPERSCFF